MAAKKNDSQLVSALLLLYDVTNKTSYDNIRAWLSEIREHANEDVVIMLLGESCLFMVTVVPIQWIPAHLGSALNIDRQGAKCQIKIA
jgi:hypothetical protein